MKTPGSRKLLALAAIVVFLLAGGGGLYWYSRGSVAEFVDQDLRKLKDEPQSPITKILRRILPKDFIGPRARLNKVLKRSLPEEFMPESPVFGIGFEPWYLWQVNTETGAGFVLIQAQPLFVTPGNSRAAIHFLDSDGNYLGSSKFSTGARIQIHDAALVANEHSGARVIAIRTTSWIVGQIVLQIYGVFDDRVALLRIENSDGKLVANHYYETGPDIGPASPSRDVQTWEALFLSSERAHVLEALMWIGGYHPGDLGPDWQKLSNLETELARNVAAVRTRASVQKRIAELANSDNLWIQEAAALALEKSSNKSNP